jgi:hypothetical protein
MASPETIDLAAFIIGTARTALIHPYLVLPLEGTTGTTARGVVPYGRSLAEQASASGIAQDGKLDG